MHMHASDMRNATTSRVLRISLVVTLAYIVLLVATPTTQAQTLTVLHNFTDAASR